eukprot:6492309-Amphidinium_carterae.2
MGASVGGQGIVSQVLLPKRAGHVTTPPNYNSSKVSDTKRIINARRLSLCPENDCGLEAFQKKTLWGCPWILLCDYRTCAAIDVRAGCSASPRGSG